MRIAAALLLVLAQDKPVFEETFAGKPGDGWNWVREDAASWKVEGGALRIKCQPGSIWFKAATAKNLLLRKFPASGSESMPVAVEVKLESAPETNGEQAGLLFYVDDNNYVKLVREFVKPKNGEGKASVVLAKESKGFPESLPPKDGTSATALRLVWSGAKVSGYFRSGDAGEWTLLGDYDTPAGEGPSAGLCASGAAADAERWAKFSGFKILKVSK